MWVWSFNSGIMFDTMLDNTYIKGKLKLFVLKRMRPFITNSIVVLMYKTCVCPFMEYADFLVESGAKMKIDNLDKIQKRTIHCADR